MPIDAHIRDPGNGQGLKVTAEGTLGVVYHDHPPVGDSVSSLPYRANFENAGSPFMMVLGSLAAPVDFTVEAVQGFDSYVKTISIEVTDTNPLGRLFGALPRLTNGVEFIHVTQAGGERILTTFRSNFELIRLGGPSTPAWGSGTSAFLFPNAVAQNADSYLIAIDLAVSLGMAYGLKLAVGSTDKFIFRVQDDLTGLTSFTAIVSGQQVRR